MTSFVMFFVLIDFVTYLIINSLTVIVRNSIVEKSTVQTGMTWLVIALVLSDSEGTGVKQSHPRIEFPPSSGQAQ